MYKRRFSRFLFLVLIWLTMHDSFYFFVNIFYSFLFQFLSTNSYHQILFFLLESFEKSNYWKTLQWEKKIRLNLLPYFLYQKIIIILLASFSVCIFLFKKFSCLLFTFCLTFFINMANSLLLSSMKIVTKSVTFNNNCFLSLSYICETTTTTMRIEKKIKKVKS